ncbi:MAG: hypothetical protein ACYCU7_18495 [Acidimicrobiales bacterium]
MCCELFSADGVAERHWRGGHHVDPATVGGLHLGPDDTWSTSADRDPAARAERLGAGRKAVA